jgi:hypothetical protein
MRDLDVEVFRTAQEVAHFQQSLIFTSSIAEA